MLTATILEQVKVAVQIPAKDSIQKSEMVSIPARETASNVFKKSCSDKEPKLPKYLHYPPEPRPENYNSNSDYDYVGENKKWVHEVKKREAINRQLFVVHRAKFKLWNAKHNWGDDAWLPSSFPKSPLAPSDSEEIELQKASLENISLPTDSPPISGLERGRSKLSNLTEETIQAKTSAGNTPLHLAAKKGQIDLIPSHLLKVEMFADRNNEGRTPLHIAAANGTLNQVPRQFFTKETLTVSSGTWTTGSGYQAHGDTVLHTAAINGHFDQIPKEFMTIEFLKIEATGYRLTVLQYLHMKNGLHVIPGVYANSAMLDYRNSRGWSLRQAIEAEKEREAYVARVRSEPATEKQKEKLRWFGCAFGDGLTKGETSDALDKCIKDFPEREHAYYSRPATEEQMDQLRVYAKANKNLAGMCKEMQEEESTLTYGAAKDLLRDSKRAAQRIEMDRFTNPPDKSQIKQLKQLGFKLDTILDEIITAADLDEILSLKGASPREDDLSLFEQHGITSFQGDALGAFALGDLIRSFGGSVQSHNRKNIDYVAACLAAVNDPEYQNPKLTRDWEGFIAFAWPKIKTNEWLRTARQSTL